MRLLYSLLYSFLIVSALYAEGVLIETTNGDFVDGDHQGSACGGATEWENLLKPKLSKPNDFPWDYGTPTVINSTTDSQCDQYYTLKTSYIYTSKQTDTKYLYNGCDSKHDFSSGEDYANYHTTIKKYLTCNSKCSIPDGVTNESYCPIVDGIQYVINRDQCACVEPCLTPPEVDNTYTTVIESPGYAAPGGAACRADMPNYSDKYTNLVCHSCPISTAPFETATIMYGKPKVICPPLVKNEVVTDHFTQEECIASNPSFLAPDGYIFFITNVHWDSCRNKCSVTKKYCPLNNVLKSGVCEELMPDATLCPDPKVIQCSTIGLGIGDTTQCFKRCYCLDSLFQEKDKSNEFMNEEVACDYSDYLTEEDFANAQNNATIELDYNVTLDDPNDLGPDPLSDVNVTIDPQNATDVKAALDSYKVAKESTQKKINNEQKLQTIELKKQNQKQEKIVNKLNRLITINQDRAYNEDYNAKATRDTMNSNTKDIVKAINDMLNAIDSLKGNSEGNTTGDSNSTNDSNTTGDNNSTNDSNNTTGGTTGDSNSTTGGGTGENNSTGGTGDSNGTGTEGEQDFKDKIMEQYAKTYSIFDVSNCGTPQFDPTIKFMDYVDIENPLKIMEDNVSQYFDSIKLVIIFSATFLGLISVFRR